MKLSWQTELPVLFLFALMVVISFAFGPLLPDRVPVHYGFDLEPNRWGSRIELLVLAPICAALTYLLVVVLPRFDPGAANYEKFAGSYRVIRIAIVAFFVALHVGILASTRGGAPDIRHFLLPGLGALLIVVGNLMGKIRPNWFIGVRTPWTLSSKTAWIRSNRAGGWVLIASGALFAVAGAVRQTWAMWIPAIVLVGGLAAVAVDSYFAWRSDPNKIPPAGTTPESG